MAVCHEEKKTARANTLEFTINIKDESQKIKDHPATHRSKVSQGEAGGGITNPSNTSPSGCATELNDSPYCAPVGD